MRWVVVLDSSDGQNSFNDHTPGDVVAEYGGQYEESESDRAERKGARVVVFHVCLQEVR